MSCCCSSWVTVSVLAAVAFLFGAGEVLGAAFPAPDAHGDVVVVV